MIWNNTSGDPLTPEQRTAFKTWIENGGSFFGIHGSGGDPVARSSSFIPGLCRPIFTWKIARVRSPRDFRKRGIVPRNGTRSIRARAVSPAFTSGFHILATVDEKSYSPGGATMGADHPLVWWHCVEKGHAVYSALGHSGLAYAEPLVIQLLDNAMSWGLAESGKDCSAGK